MYAAVATIKRFSQRLADAVELAASALLFLLVIVVFTGVVDRYLLKTGMVWPEELSRYLLLWTSFLAAASAAHRAAHYTVGFFADRLLGTRRARRWLAAAVFFASAGLFALLVPKAATLVDLGSRQASPSIGMPMSAVFASVLVGMVGVAFFFFSAALESLAAVPRPGTPPPKLEGD